MKQIEPTDPLDLELADFFAGELGGQAGQAAGRFTAHESPAPPAPMAIAVERMGPAAIPGRFRAILQWSAIGLAAGFALALLMMRVVGSQAAPLDRTMAANTGDSRAVNPPNLSGDHPGAQSSQGDSSASGSGQDGAAQDRTAKGNDLAPASAPPLDLKHYSYSKTHDGGMVVSDEQIPYRRITRQVVEGVQWQDPATGATIMIRVPRQQVYYVQMNSY